MTSIILATVWAWAQSTLLAFWPWLVGGASAVLAFMFSPSIRKYTLGVIAVAIILAATYLYGYNSNHSITTVTHSCSEFQKVLVSGSATNKAIAVFKRHGLCE